MFLLMCRLLEFKCMPTQIPAIHSISVKRVFQLKKCVRMDCYLMKKWLLRMRFTTTVSTIGRQIVGKERLTTLQTLHQVDRFNSFDRFLLIFQVVNTNGVSSPKGMAVIVRM